MKDHPLKEHIDADIRTDVATKLLASKSSVPPTEFKEALQRIANDLRLQSTEDVATIIRKFRHGAQIPVAKSVWDKFLAFARLQKR